VRIVKIETGARLAGVDPGALRPDLEPFLLRVRSIPDAVRLVWAWSLLLGVMRIVKIEAGARLAGVDPGVLRPDLEPFLLRVRSIPDAVSMGCEHVLYCSAL